MIFNGHCERAPIGIPARIRSGASDRRHTFGEAGTIRRQATDRRAWTIIIGRWDGVIDHSSASAQSGVGRNVARAGQCRQFGIIDRDGKGARIGVATGVSEEVAEQAIHEPGWGRGSVGVWER